MGEAMGGVEWRNTEASDDAQREAYAQRCANFRAMLATRMAVATLLSVSLFALPASLVSLARTSGANQISPSDVGDLFLSAGQLGLGVLAIETWALYLHHRLGREIGEAEDRLGLPPSREYSPLALVPSVLFAAATVGLWTFGFMFRNAGS